MIAEVSNRINETFKEGIVRIAGIIIDDYTKDGVLDAERLTKFFLSARSPVEIFKLIYHWSVLDGMKPIEDLEPEEKRELWLRSGKNKEVCKALYVVQSIYQTI